MSVKGRSKAYALTAAFFIVVILFGTTTLTGDPLGMTTVGIDPPSQMVSAGDTFTVNVSCVPGQPINAFELKLSFDASLLQANSVTQGNIFDGYTTIFNPCTIDNTTGTILYIYSLIIGPGNVSDPGTFVTISFTAKNASGTSSLDIDDVGVTDEAGYISIVVSDGSITVQGTQNGNPPEGGGGSPGGGGYIPPVVVDDGNTAPETPVKPSGPTFVEIGLEYLYMSSTVDVDGDRIRFRFDWGDENYSDWSEFVASNTPVLTSHSWTIISTYEVKVIAQDENGLNSSWSRPLNVNVSKAVLGEVPPVANFDIPSNVSVNQTIVFNASSSFDEDGVIVSYYWDFGDGENDSGVSPSHVYKDSGKYNVTLVVTDNNGNTYSKSIIVNITSNSEAEDKQGIIPFNLGIVIFGFVIAIFVCLTIVVRASVKLFLSTHHIHLFSHARIFNRANRIKKIDVKIKKLKKSIQKVT